MSITSKTKITALLIFSFFLLPLAIKADTFGQKTNFFVDSSYDLSNREKISAVLLGLSPKLYFYVDEDWWNLQNIYQQADIKNSINFLDSEFENKIYPTLTSTFGSEPKPGIDNDERLTILIHQMKKEAGGYFNNGDEYSKLENPKSNEREMVYLNTNYLKFDIIKSYLAHEFTHLITFNQKEKIQGVSEDVWLNEARADYSPTLLGYDKEYQGSNLQQRVKQFITSPNNSLTEWQNQKADYGVVNLFTQYLVDHYGIKILTDSLHSKEAGIASINDALKKNGFSQDFSQIFTDWTIAVFLNDCNFGPRYCYKSENLKNLRITPYIYFLPLAGESNLSTGYFIKEWSGNWQKIVGGKGTLTLDLDGEDDANFKVLYIVCDFQEKCELQSLNLDQEQKGKIILREFNSKYYSLIIIPSIQSKTSGFTNQGKSYLFSWKASTAEKTEEEKEAELKKQLLAQIDDLKKQIEKLSRQIEELLARQLTEIPAGFEFKKNLSFDVSHPDVIYLKKVLINQNCLSGQSNTRLFDSQTLEGVKCFCQKYKTEISNFAGSNVSCSGFVGKGIRAKLNQLIGRRTSGRTSGRTSDNMACGKLGLTYFLANVL